MSEPATIVKYDDDLQVAFGWASVCIRKDGKQVVDSQNHVIEPTELELAAYSFMLHSREGDEMHTDAVKCQCVESVFFSPEKLEKMGLAADALPTGWWVGFYVEDREAWEKVKKGEYSMFSIAGTAVMEDAE